MDRGRFSWKQSTEFDFRGKTRETRGWWHFRARAWGSIAMEKRLPQRQKEGERKRARELCTKAKGLPVTFRVALKITPRPKTDEVQDETHDGSPDSSGTFAIVRNYVLWDLEIVVAFGNRKKFCLLLSWCFFLCNVCKRIFLFKEWTKKWILLCLYIMMIHLLKIC